MKSGNDVTFAEGLHDWARKQRRAKFVVNGKTPVDPNSVALRDRALEIQETDKISFGEALREARAERGPEFSESSGTPVDPRSLEILRRTREIAEEHP